MGIGVAILGMGRWGRAWERVLRSAPQTRVVATSRSAQCPDFSDAIAADGVEAVIVTLPVELHLEAVRQAVSAGMQVLCEKPAVPSRSDLEALQALASTSDSVVRVCQNYRARSWALRARASVEDLGPLTHVSADFAQREFLEGGRGTLRHPLLADLSIHHLDLLRWLTGQEARVLAARSARPGWSQYLGESDVAVLLELEGGASATYTATWSSRGTSTPWDGTWSIRGERGSVEVVDGRVRVRRGEHLVEHWATREGDDRDLLRVWEDFSAVIDGQSVERGSAAVTVAEHALSLGLVLDVAEAAGVVAPHGTIDDE